MNKELQEYLLVRHIENLKNKIKANIGSWFELEPKLDGLLDHIDSHLNLAENIAVIHTEIEKRGISLNFIEEEKILKQREKDFNTLYNNLAQFRNKVFQLNNRTQLLRQELNHFQRGYNKLNNIWRELTYLIQVSEFDYSDNNKFEVLLSMLKKNDTFRKYNKTKPKSKRFRKKLLVTNPRNDVPKIRKLSAKDMFRH